jgi:hypothetical protein
MRNAYIWLRLLKTHLVMLFNAVSLVGTTIVTSLLGFAYWWIAARLCPPNVVGLASALISAMTLLATISMSGLGTLLTGELSHQPGQEWRLINAALLIVGGIGMGVGILFALGVPLFTSAFDSLRMNAWNPVLFALGVSLTTVTLVLDQAYIGVMRGDLQFWRNALFATVKLGALGIACYVLAARTGISIYETWLVGNLVSLVILFFGGRPRIIEHKAGESRIPLVRSPKGACPECGALSPQQACFCPACGYPLTPTIELASVRLPLPSSKSRLESVQIAPIQSGKSSILAQWKKLGKAALQHHVLNLILLVPPLVLPLLVTIQLSAMDNAWFYVSFMLANLVFSLTYALTTALYAVSAARPSLLVHSHERG